MGTTKQHHQSPGNATPRRPARALGPLPPATANNEWSAEFKRWRAGWEEKSRQREAEWERVWGNVVQAAQKLGCYENPTDQITLADFITVLKQRKKIGGLAFTEMHLGLKHHYKYSFVGVGPTAVVLGDYQEHMSVAAVTAFATRRLPYFSTDFPAYAQNKIYGLVCAAHFTPGALHEAKKINLLVLRFRRGKPVTENARTARPVSG